MRHLRMSSLLVGAIGSVLVTMSSTYVALKMGALPWPTVFAALFSMLLLKPFKATLHDVNVAHTAVSAGGLVAGGLAFTVPALWMKGGSGGIGWIIGASAAGVILGVGLTVSTRKRYVEELDLPFPMGVAAYHTIKAGDEGGKKARWLFWSMGLSAIFTYLRDGLGLVPVILWNFGMFPMAVGIGFMIGSLVSLSWLAGGVLKVIVGIDWLRDFGLGMMIGGGLALAVKGLFKGKGIPMFSKWELMIAAVAFAVALPWLDPLRSLALALLTVVMVHMAGAVDGSTGVDPMETFSIITLMIIGVFSVLGNPQAAFIAAVVAVATGLAGDSLQDMKTGKLLGTDPRAQIVAEAVGAVVGALLAPVLIFYLYKVHGAAAFGNPQVFPAPQAKAVSAFFGSTPPVHFWIGVAVAFVLQLLSLPALPFGIGLYLPLFITLPVALGGILNLVMRGKAREIMNVVSSGMLGGEGVTGVIIGLIKPFLG